MKHRLGLKFKKAFEMAPHNFSPKNVVLRQQCARLLILQLSQGKRIISIDESWLGQGIFIRKGWAPPRNKIRVDPKPFARRLLVICAMDNFGEIFYSVTHANVCSEVFSLFMLRLCQELDRLDPDWRA